MVHRLIELELQRKWDYYYKTIIPKQEFLKKYCEKYKFIPFNYTKKMNNKYYDECKPKLCRTEPH